MPESPDLAGQSDGSGTPVSVSIPAVMLPRLDSMVVRGMFARRSLFLLELLRREIIRADLAAGRTDSEGCAS